MIRKIFFTVVVCTVLCIASLGSNTLYTIDDCEDVIGVYNFGDNDFLVLYICGSTYHFALTDGENISLYDTQISADNNAVSYSGESLYFFENIIDEDVPAVKICRYDCINNTKKYYAVNSEINVVQGNCAANNSEEFYFINGTEINIYRDCKLAETINIDNDFVRLIPSYSGETIFCTTSSGVIILSENDYYTLPVQSDNIYPAKEFFSDRVGTVYSSDGEVLCDKFDGTHGSLTANGCYFGIKGGRLVQIYNEKETELCKMNQDTYLCMGSDRFICVSGKDGFAEITFMSSEPVESGTDGTSDTDNENKDSTINLDDFELSGDFICGIEPGTTTAQMKKMLDPKNCTVTFYTKDGAEKKSGVVGTGCALEIEGERTNRYTIIIYGDVSGEGNINISDRRMMMKYLLNNETAERAEKEAADINHDGRIDLSDLSGVNMYINGEYSISQQCKSYK